MIWRTHKHNFTRFLFFHFKPLSSLLALVYFLSALLSISNLRLGMVGSLCWIVRSTYLEQLLLRLEASPSFQVCRIQWLVITPNRVLSDSISTLPGHWLFALHFSGWEIIKCSTVTTIIFFMRSSHISFSSLNIQPQSVIGHRSSTSQWQRDTLPLHYCIVLCTRRCS